MRVLIAVSIILVLVATVFALQNSQPVSVNFLRWVLEAPLVVILLMTFLAGGLAAFLVSIPWRMKISRELSALRKTHKNGSQRADSSS